MSIIERLMIYEIFSKLKVSKLYGLFVGSIDKFSSFSYSYSIYMSKGSIFKLLSDLAVTLVFNESSLGIWPCFNWGSDLLLY